VPPTWRLSPDCNGEIIVPLRVQYNSVVELLESTQADVSESQSQKVSVVPTEAYWPSVPEGYDEVREASSINQPRYKELLDPSVGLGPKPYPGANIIIS
jgi:hypothetical protein